MTFDEVKEGQKVLLVGASHPNLTSGIIYIREGSYLTFATGTHKKQKASLTPENYKYIPVPQDRPKPRIWDGHLSNSGEFTIKILKDYPSLDRFTVKKHHRFFRALAAWSNHVLESEDNG